MFHCCIVRAFMFPCHASGDSLGGFVEQCWHLASGHQHQVLRQGLAVLRVAFLASSMLSWHLHSDFFPSSPCRHQVTPQSCNFMDLSGLVPEPWLQILDYRFRMLITINHQVVHAANLGMLESLPDLYLFLLDETVKMLLCY